MPYIQTIVISLVSAIIVVGLTIVLTGRAHAQQHNYAPAVAAMMGEGKQPHHAWQPRGQPRFARWCAENSDERVDGLITLVEGRLSLNAEQQTAWQPVTEALRAGGLRIGAACNSLTSEGVPATSPEKLARAESWLSVGLATVQQLRPPFEHFYAGLNAEQQQTLNDLFKRHPHRPH